MKIYGNLLIGLKKTRTKKSDLCKLLSITPSTLQSRLNSDDTWTLKEMNAIKHYFDSKGYSLSIGELFERI